MSGKDEMDLLTSNVFTEIFGGVGYSSGLAEVIIEGVTDDEIKALWSNTNGDTTLIRRAMIRMIQIGLRENIGPVIVE